MIHRQQFTSTYHSCLASCITPPIRLLYLFVQFPSVVFVMTLTLTMFRHPDVPMPPFDRVAFMLLCGSLLLFVLFNRIQPAIYHPILVPMACLIIVSILPVIDKSYSAQTWSLIANKYLVPFTLFFLSRVAFRDAASRQHFFIFCVVVTLYLTFTSIAFLVNAESLIFPRFILDPAIGPPEHIDRARGPFLNAVPNGIAITICGLSSLYWFKIKSYSVPYWVFLATIPIAVLATMTRGVWLSFGVCALLLFFNKKSGARKNGIILLLFSLISIAALTSFKTTGKFIQDRFQDKENIEFRLNLINAGVEMFKKQPVYGIGTNQIPSQIPFYLANYTDDVWVHNTYLEILIEHGLAGMALYMAIIVFLFRIGRRISAGGSPLTDNSVSVEFVFMWRLFLCVYLLNGFFVVMNYQFVNALIFTIAGIISGAETHPGADGIKDSK